MSEIDNRRPLKVRGAKLSQRFARWLSQTSVTPNQISTASVFFAILAAGMPAHNAACGRSCGLGPAHPDSDTHPVSTAVQSV